MVVEVATAAVRHPVYQERRGAKEKGLDHPDWEQKAGEIYHVLVERGHLPILIACSGIVEVKVAWCLMKAARVSWLPYHGMVRYR